MLKNSARNCTLKVSEIFGTCVFLNTEKSTVVSLGPYKLLRPALPTRFWQYCVPAGAAGAPGKELGAHPTNEVGSVGSVKQFRLR